MTLDREIHVLFAAIFGLYCKKGENHVRFETWYGRLEVGVRATQLHRANVTAPAVLLWNREPSLPPLLFF